MVVHVYLITNSFLSQKSVSKKHEKFCGYSLKLLFEEPNKLGCIIGKICNNSLATIVWGQILSKYNNFVPLSYLIFCLSFVFTLFFLDYFVYYTKHI